MALSASTDWTLNRDQVITGALRKLGVLASGGTPTANQISEGAIALNALVKAFQADGMPVWAIASKTFTVTSGTSTYTVGPAQTVSTTATPLKVLQAWYVPNGGNNTPMHVENRYDFNFLPSSTTITGIPISLYYQPGYQFGTIKLWPVPSDSVTTVTFDYQTMFDDLDNATDNFFFPSYWMQALIYNLAWTLAPEYGTPVLERSTLKDEANFWHKEALGYGTEEGSLYLQPVKEHR